MTPKEKPKLMSSQATTSKVAAMPAISGWTLRYSMTRVQHRRSTQNATLMRLSAVWVGRTAYESAPASAGGGCATENRLPAFQRDRQDSHGNLLSKRIKQ